MEKELIGWKAKIYDAIRKSANLPVDQKEKVNPLIQDLHQMVDDIDSRLSLLEKECPVEWDSHKTEIEGKMSQMNDRWKNVWGAMGEPEYGIGGA
jgi:hypothetical protein